MDDGQGVGGRRPGVRDEKFRVDLRFTLHEIRFTVFFGLDFSRSLRYLKYVETEQSKHKRITMTTSYYKSRINAFLTEFTGGVCPKSVMNSQRIHSATGIPWPEGG